MIQTKEVKGVAVILKERAPSLRELEGGREEDSLACGGLHISSSPAGLASSLCKPISLL